MTTTTGDQLIAAVCEHPEADDPRLAYADWLQERDEPGDADRAEFIRVQVAIARTPMFLASECKVCSATADAEGWVNHGKGCYMLDADGGGIEPADRNPEWEQLRAREGELFAGELGRQLRDQFPSHRHTVSPGTYDGRADPCCLIRRGFVEAVTFPDVAAFLEAADAGLWRRHPITRAVIADREPSLFARDYRWWLSVRGYELDNPAYVPGTLPQILYDQVRGHFTSRQLALDALSAACVRYGRERARTRGGDQ